MGEIDALIQAAKAGDLDALRRMLKAHPGLVVQRMPSGESPLMAALYRGNHEIVEALVNAGAEVDVFAAAATGRLEALQKALTLPGTAAAYSYDGWTSLHLASFFGQLAAARVLLAAGADVRARSRNSLENTPLHAATAGKHASLALLLLDYGADPEALDAGGSTATRIAAENRLDAVSAAIEARRR